MTVNKIVAVKVKREKLNLSSHAIPSAVFQSLENSKKVREKFQVYFCLAELTELYIQNSILPTFKFVK